MIILHFDLQPQFKYMNYFIYSCFEKGEKLTRQCRKLLWVKVVFKVAWVNLKVFQRGRRKQHKKQAKPNSHYPWCHSALSLTLLHFRGTTFVETAVYLSSFHSTQEIWTQQIDLAPNVWLHSSVGRASHRYRGGHGFESRWSPEFLRLLLSNCLK